MFFTALFNANLAFQLVRLSVVRSRKTEQGKETRNVEQPAFSSAGAHFYSDQPTQGPSQILYNRRPIVGPQQCTLSHCAGVASRLHAASAHHSQVLHCARHTQYKHLISPARMPIIMHPLSAKSASLTALHMRHRVALCGKAMRMSNFHPFCLHVRIKRRMPKELPST